MNVKVRKTKSSMKINPVGKEAFPIKTKLDYPSAHFLITAYGRRGSGKTTSITSLIMEGVKDKIWDEDTQEFISIQSLYATAPNKQGKGSNPKKSR